MDNKMDRLMESLSQPQREQIEKVVFERYPEKRYWACASQKLQMQRLREAMAKREIDKLLKEKIEH